MSRPAVISFAMYSHIKAVEAAAFTIRTLDPGCHPGTPQGYVASISWPHLTGLLFQADCHHLRTYGRPITAEEWHVTSQGLEPSGLKAVLDGDPVALARLTTAEPCARLYRDPAARSRICAEVPAEYDWRRLSASDCEAIAASLFQWRELGFVEALHHGRRLAIPLMSPGGRIPYENIIVDPERIESVLDIAGYGHFGS